jgi:hypothetical protein
MTSVEFLQQFHPAGYWVLTAIRVDRKGIETVTFTPDQVADTQEWLDQRTGKANIYFSVNQPHRPVSKKATRDDIATVNWLHVDVDARAGEPLEKELPRIKDVLLKRCPVAPPTAVVFSGGGYQAFWKLDEPVPVRTPAAKADVTRYNRQLELVLEGDSCHNIDRIMRLPGTMNLPNAKKVERGRTPALATVELFEPDRIYQLTDFTPAPAVQTPGIGHNEPLPAPTGNIERLDNLDVLDKWKVPDRVKVIIVQGEHPDEVKEGDNSRSAWLFDAICQLVRCEVPDEIIYSIVTDPDFGISASVLDKRPNETEYAMRQIQRAKEEVEEPWLRKLNEQFFVVGSVGGKCLVLEEVMDETMNRSRLTKQTFTDFRNRFSNVYIELGKKMVTIAQWWLAHPKRRQYDYVVFNPSGSAPNTYNLWQGFGCGAVPGDRHLSYLRHLHKNICMGFDEYYKYLIGWMARTVQKPGQPGETAVVLRGKSGTGKSFFANQFGSLFGRHFLQVSDAKHLVGAFNAHLRDCVVLFGDEAFYAGDKKHESVLKTLITERRMVIEQKFVDAEASPNFTHLILASNSEWVVPTGPTERRFFVLDVGDEKKQDSDYFRGIADDLDNGGRENLLHYLMNYDLEGFQVRRVPSTKALFDQKLQSLDPFHEWWYYRLERGTLLENESQYNSVVNCNELLEGYLNHVRRFNLQRIGNATRLGQFLRSVCPGEYPHRTRSSSGRNRPYVYEFPPLADLREYWENLFGVTLAWPKDPGSSQQETPF